ncbi:Kallikrein 1-related peptidase [Trichinella spiralis]|uniref:Kallikrein 1-related peptidase n=1 Tax=Trichinella spiralis TaxID=6334 RepID=A0ABR3KFG9_TRISP
MIFSSSISAELFVVHPWHINFKRSNAELLTGSVNFYPNIANIAQHDYANSATAMQIKLLSLESGEQQRHLANAIHASRRR